MSSRATRLHGLDKTAECLAGRIFPGYQHFLLGAWGLSPRQWLYVVRKLDQCQVGWRRRRAFKILRLIARTRNTLVSPVVRIHCSIIWPGVAHCDSSLKSCIRRLLTDWRAVGLHVLMLRRTILAISWKATASMRQLLSAQRASSYCLSGAATPS